jgi:hypothetical protein
MNEALLLWHARRDELVMLVKCFVSVAGKEARKRRADLAGDDDGCAAQAAGVPDERFFKFELDRTLVDTNTEPRQQLAAVRAAAYELIEGQRTLVRHCALSLTGKQSGQDAEDISRNTC